MKVKIDIPVNNEHLTGELFSSRTSRQGMLFVHGWTSSNRKYLKLAEDLTSFGFLCLAVNLRGHGDSPYQLNRYSREDHLIDIVAAFDYLKQLLTGEKVITVLGKSYGGYLCAVATSLRVVDYLILAQPALYPNNGFNQATKKLIDENPNVFRSEKESLRENRALKAISQYNKPLLLIESERDEEIPKVVTNQYRVAAAANKQVAMSVLTGANHSLSDSKSLVSFYELVKEWLVKRSII